MSGKSTMAIFAIGVLGMIALGVITKYAVDSSPVLAEVTRVKIVETRHNSCISGAIA